MQKMEILVQLGIQLLTFRQFVEVNVEAQHEGSGDKAEGRSDGGHSQKDSCKTPKWMDVSLMDGSHIWTDLGLKIGHIWTDLDLKTSHIWTDPGLKTGHIWTDLGLDILMFCSAKAFLFFCKETKSTLNA